MEESIHEESSVNSNSTSHCNCQVLDREVTNPSTTTIEHLMPEILYGIFSHCIPSDLTMPLARVAPFNLSTVCKTWREVVLNHCSLWSSVQLYIDHQLCPNESTPGTCLHPVHALGERFIRSWERWLELSGDSPLSINLSIILGPDPVSIAEIVQKTFEQHHRWQSCGIQFLAPQQNPIVAEMKLVLRLPSILRDLNIIFFNGMETYRSVFFHLEMASATSLSELGIPMARVIIPQPVGRMERLTVLTVFEMNFDAFLEVLRNAPSLRTFSVGVSVGDAGIIDGGDDASKIALQNLKNIGIRMNPRNVTALSHLFGRLFAPSLLELKLEANTDEEIPPTDLWTVLTTCLEHSRPPLEILSLQSRLFRSHALILRPRADASPSSDGALISMLEGLPKLKTLQLGGAIASTRLFDALARNRADADGGILCPLLREVIELKDGYDNFELHQNKPRVVGLHAGLMS